MKKAMSLAAIVFAVACSSPENRADGTDSTGSSNETGVTNSPPGGSTDTSGSFGGDSARSDTGTMNGSGSGTSGSGGTGGTGTGGSGIGSGTSGSAGSGTRAGTDTTRR